MVTLRVRELHRGDTTRVHAVDSINVERVRTDQACRVLARMKPVAVIVSNSANVQAFDIAGMELDMQDLTARVPELAELV